MDSAEEIKTQLTKRTLPTQLTKRTHWNTTFMRMVEVLAERSSCVKYKTACILVKGTQIISMGYNGTFSKCDECCDYWYDYWKHKTSAEHNIYNEWLKTDEFKNMHRVWSLKNEVHAENNALNWISKRDIDDTCILFTLYSPCDKCTTQIISYGIKKVYYKYEYPNGADARTTLLSHNVLCEQI